MKELIKQLREVADSAVLTKVYSACTAAADTIEDLQAKLEKAVCIREERNAKYLALHREYMNVCRALKNAEAERDELRKKLDRITESKVTLAERDVAQAKLALIKNVLEL